MELLQYLFGALCAGVYFLSEWKHQKCKENANNLHKTLSNKKSGIF